MQVSVEARSMALAHTTILKLYNCGNCYALRTCESNGWAFVNPSLCSDFDFAFVVVGGGGGCWCSIQTVEDMMTDQLISAIGKRVHVDDFSKYMAYHNQKIFRQVFLVGSQ